MTPTAHDLAWVAGEFDRRAATYDASEMHVWQARRAAELLDVAPAAARVLDIATGTGLAARSVIELTTRTRVIGVDVSSQMLQVARAASDPRRSRYLRARADRLPFRAELFDGLICVAAVPYLPDLPAALAEWRRVGRAGARLVLTTPAADGIAAHALLRRAAATHGLDLPNPHADYGSPERLRAILAEAGMTRISVSDDSVPDLLEDDPQAAFAKVIDYGFAESVRDAPDDLRAAVRLTYAELYAEARARADSAHVTLFTRCRLPDG